MSNGNSGKPKNAQKARGAATATAAVVQQAAKPVAAKVADAVAKAVEAPAKKPQPVRAAEPAAPVQPAVLNQPAKAASVEAPKVAPVAAKAAPVAAPKPAPVAASKPVPAAAPKAEPVAPKAAPVAAPKAAPVEAAKAAPAPAAQPKQIVEAPKVAAPAAEAPKRVEIAQPTINTTPTMTNVTQTGANIMNETINRTQEATQQVAQQATEQFRGAMNDANQRGQVAMEKSARIVEEMADLARGNMEAFVASSKTAAKYVETLTQSAADYNRRSFEQASATLRSFAEVKSPTDFFRLQGDYARSAFDAIVSESARMSETMIKLTGDVAEPITSRYSVAAERVKNVAA